MDRERIGLKRVKRARKLRSERIGFGILDLKEVGKSLT